MKKLLILVLVLAIMPLSSYAFTGSLSTASGGVVATGNWATTGFVISWDIQQMANLSWCYTYTMTDLLGNNLVGTPSHFTLEVSHDVGENYFWGFAGSTEFTNSDDTKDLDGINDALKLDWQADSYTFYSWKGPVLGDFYTKNGFDQPTSVFNTAYNSGFGVAGTEANKIYRPDSYCDIPEPGTMLLFGMGLAGAGVFRRRKKQ